MFLTTKLFLPAPPPGLVTRERLYALLDEAWAAQARLLLLCAPPGYGKTVLLSNWLRARNAASAWISLDPEDNDPAHFFHLLCAALEGCLPGIGELRQALNLPGGARFDRLAAEVINRAAGSAEVKGGFLLALDDYHRITSPAIHVMVEQLITHLPPWLRIAVLTREDPPFALARLRARRQSLELRARELTFSDAEGGDLLLEALRLPLDSAQVERLLERTEGWAAGLQLVALTLRGAEQPERTIESFSGSHRFVMDYLAEELLDRLPPDLRDFLCRSAVLGRFTAELCDAALERTGSREAIAQAAGANLFLVPLDEERAWFRYHHLMADILTAEVPAEERAALCSRAARWWWEREQPAEAVRLALAAHDYPLACTILRAAVMPAAENGLLSTALGWLDALPRAVLAGEPELSVIRAWFLTYNGRFGESAAWAAEVLANHPDLPPPLRGLLDGLLAWLPTIAGDNLDLTRLQSAYALTGGRYPYFAPMMLMVIAQAQRETGDFDGALANFEEGQRLAEGLSEAVSALIISNNRAFLLDEIGQHQQAAALCQAQIERYSDANGQPGLLAGIPMILYGCLLYEAGRLEEAATILTQAIHLASRLGLYEILCAPANHHLQYLLADQGRLDDALALNREVRRRALKAGLGVVVQDSEMIAAALHALRGDPREAARWAAANPLPPDALGHPRHTTRIQVHARVLLEAGKQAQAVDLLRAALSQPSMRRLVKYRTRLQIELALALHAVGEKDEALEALAEAVEGCPALDYVQIFCLPMPRLEPLLRMLRSRYPALVDAVLEGGYPRVDGTAGGGKPGSAAGAGLVEALTPREMEVLRLVAAGLGNAEIAARLYLSTGTVKWFLNQILGKLGARRRTEAVARAREAGLL